MLDAMPHAHCSTACCTMSCVCTSGLHYAHTLIGAWGVRQRKQPILFVHWASADVRWRSRLANEPLEAADDRALERQEHFVDVLVR